MQTQNNIGSLLGLFVAIIAMILSFFAIVDMPKRCKLSMSLGSDILCPDATSTLAPIAVSPKESLVEVDASKLWQDSGIEVNPGDRVAIQYISGTWGEESLDANGARSGYICAQVIPASQCTELVPDAVQSSLIGKVGTQILKIGDHLEFTVEQKGSLLFSKNQDVVGFELHGDSGIISIQVTVTKGE